VLPLLERCTRELQEIPRYKDDVRYLRVWVKYADCCKEPHDIFKFLQANDIGQKHTLFYEAYAAFLEIRGAFKQANEVYDRGVLMRAEPRDRLKQKLAQFGDRMKKRELRRLDESVDGERETPVGSSRRFGAGGTGRGVGSSSGAKRNRGFRGIAAAASSSSAETTNNNNAGDGGLEIYCDDENGAPPPVNAANAPAAWRNLGTIKETKKENSQSATTWAGQTLKQKRARPGQSGAPPPAETLEIYEDEDLAEAEAEAAANAVATAKANVKAAAKNRNANALRRRLDIADGGGDTLAENPMLYHGRGAAVAGEAAALRRPVTSYGRYVPADVNRDDACYEERRAVRWVAKNGPVPSPRDATAAAAAAETDDMDVETKSNERKVTRPMHIGGAFATTTATTAPVLPPLMEEEEAMNSPDGQSAPPVVPPPRFEMGSSEAPPSTGASQAPPRMLHPTDEATGVPAMAAPPVTDLALARPDQPPVPAGLRWTATEGGTYGVQDPTMTICTKEAWGDIMSMFSGGLAAETEAEAKRAKKAAEAPAPVAKAPSPAPVVRAPPPAVADEDAFAIYEDTCLIPANAAAAVAEKAATENASAFEGLDIREDTVVIPQNAFAPAATPAAAASTRIPLAPTPASTRIPLAPTPASVRPPLAPRAAMPPPESVAKTPSARAAAPCDENATPTQEITLEPHPLTVTAGEDSPTVDVPSGPRAPANTPDQAGLSFDVYQDTVLVDPAAVNAAVNAAGVDSRASVAPSQATTSATDSGEPSEGNTENTAPAGAPLVDLFEPRHIADAAAATAALQPLSKQRAAALDMLTTIPSDENARRAAEETLRTAQPPPELAGEDAFEVYADDDETAQIPMNRLVTTLHDTPDFR